MSIRDQDLNPTLKTLKKSFIVRYGFFPLYWSSSCCLHHILGHIDPNEVNQNPTETRYLGK